MSDQLPSVSDDDRAFLIEEFKAAWSHYQHIENVRNSYLAAILATVIAVLGVTAAILRSAGPLPAMVWVVIALLFLTLGAASYLIRQMVRACSPVLHHYENVLKRTRLLYFKESAREIDALFNVRSDPDVAARSDLQRVSYLTEALISTVFQASLVAAIVSLVVAVTRTI
jgi:hypothetical protein